MTGKTRESYLQEGIAIYEKRVRRYLPFQSVVLPDIRRGGKLPPEKLRLEEGKQVMQRLQTHDRLILLDERGKAMGSVDFARQLQRELQLPAGKLIFLIGGAYGFDTAVKERADLLLSLSNMTFSHQMVRLFFLEQLYRALTILHNEPYHNA